MSGTNRWSWPAALLALLLAAPALGQGEQREDDAALRQELKAAREQMEQAARRVAELSRQLGEDRAIRIQRFGSSKRPMLGVVLGRSDGKGVRLDAVTPDGPAAKAGLRSGDVVVAIDGGALDAAEPSQRMADARRRLADLEENQKVKLDYERDGRRAQAEVTAEALSPMAFIGGFDNERFNIDIDMEKLGSDLERGLADVHKRIRVIGPMLEDTIRFDAWRWQGLRLAPLDEDLGRYFGTQQGVLVLKAEGESLGDLKSGDVIVAIGGESVDEPREAMRRLSRAEPGERLSLTVLRDKRRMELALTAPEQPDVLRWMGFPEPPEPPAPPALPAPPPPTRGPDTLI